MNYMNISKVMESGGQLMNESIKLVKINTSHSVQSNSNMSSMSSQCQQSMNLSQNQSSLTSNINLVDLGKKLLDASRNGETEEVRALMQSGAPFTTDWLGTSPLHFAAQFGHSDTAEVLLRAGISRDARTKVDRTPLHIASQEGHLAIVSLLIMHGSDVDSRDMLRMTPLHWAVERGHTDVVDCLLSNGADINIQSKFEKTPIDIAYDNGRLEMVPTLQKYVGITRTKPEPKPSSAPAVKMRPIVLPNKSNRTPKSAKNYHQSKPLFIPGANFTNWKKGINFELSNVRKILTGFGDMSYNSDDGNASTSNPVLATLAALAAANSVSANTTVADALQWLETHGINMNNTSTDAAIFQNAFESGQTMSLTEAGKLALNFVKDQQIQSSVTNSNTNTKNSKVITIVADSAQLPQIISSTDRTPIVLVSGSSLQDSTQTHSHNSTQSRFANRKNTNSVKIAKTYTTTNSRINNVSKSPNIKHVLISNTSNESERERDKLFNELKSVKQELEDYKNKLLEKDKEIERYKKLVEELRAIHK